MKAFFVGAIFLASLASAQTRWKEVETMNYDWGGPGKPATFILEIPSNYDRGGEFTRVRILTPGHPEFVLLDEDGFTNLNDACEYKTKVGVCKKPNPVSSDRLFFIAFHLGAFCFLCLAGPTLVLPAASMRSHSMRVECRMSCSR
jgi:hypothetical protein